MIATAPRTLEAATSLLSLDRARAIIGTGAASTSHWSSPSLDRKKTLPLAPAVTMPPSGPTTTELSGVGNVTILGEVSSVTDQTRTVRSYPAVTTARPSGVNATPLTFC